MYLRGVIVARVKFEALSSDFVKDYPLQKVYILFCCNYHSMEAVFWTQEMDPTVNHVYASI